MYVGSLQAAADERHVKVEGPQPASDLEHMSSVQSTSSRPAGGGVFAVLRISATVSPKRATSRSSTLLVIPRMRPERYEGQLNYSSTISTSDGESDANRNVLTVNGTRYFSGRWLVFSQVGYEHNLELQLEKRVSFLGVPGFG